MPASPRTRPEHPRLLRELKTIEAMIAIHCRDHHSAEFGTASALPCVDCRELAAYAAKRLAVCPYQAEKPTCAKCPIHCYAPAKREQVRRIMGYAGPRMTLRHPWLALLHMLDGLRPVPEHPASRRAREKAAAGGK